MAYSFHGIEYIPDENGVAAKVKCPLVDSFIEDIDCLENQDISQNSIPGRFKVKPDWKEICESCPFRNY